jgi:hypothetical protein
MIFVAVDFIIMNINDKNHIIIILGRLFFFRITSFIIAAKTRQCKILIPTQEVNVELRPSMCAIDLF